MAEQTVPHMHRAFLGLPILSNEWERDEFIGPEIQQRGERACDSGNWCLTAGCIALYVGRPYARGFWLRHFAEAREGRFMGKEPFSRIYAHWHLLPVILVHWLATRDGDTELAVAARGWLRAFWHYLGCMTVGANQIPTWEQHRFSVSLASSWCGARSFERGDGPDGSRHTGIPYHLDNWVTGAIFNRALYSAASWSSGWFEDVLAELQALEDRGHNWSGLTEADRLTLRRVVNGAIAGPERSAIRSALRDYRPVATWRLLRTAEGVTWFVDGELAGRGVSTATAPLYGAWTSRNGGQQWLGVDNGFRPAGEMRGIAVSLGHTERISDRIYASRGDGLIFRADIEALRPWIRIPGGDVLLDMLVGPEGVAVLPLQGDEVAPPAPNPPTGSSPLPPPRTSSPSAQEVADWLHRNAYLTKPDGSQVRPILADLFQAVWLVLSATNTAGDVDFTETAGRGVQEALLNALHGVRVAQTKR